MRQKSLPCRRSRVPDWLMLPLVSAIVPVGIAEPDAPATVTVTERACSVLMFAADGVTVTVGVRRFTVTVAVPEALVYTDELAESGV